MPKTLDQAIAQMEGFFNAPGSPAQRNNNPGNLRAGPGMIGTDSKGLAIFPDVATGWAALDAWIASHSNMPLSQAVDTYLGIKRDAQGNIVGNVDKNDPESYLNGLVQMTGLQPTDTLSNATTLAGMTTPPDTTTNDGSSGLPIDLSSIDLTSLTVWVGIGIGILGVAMTFGD